MDKSLPVLVTGASGFIATHTIIQLLQKGYAVRGTVRNLARTEHLTKVLAKHAPTERLSFAQADLMDAEAWQAAVKGCNAIMHIASPIGTELPKNPDDMIVPATQGTRHVLQAALDQGVERVIVTSSTAAIMYGHGKDAPEVYTEAHFTNPDHAEVTPYIKSKTLAERVVWEMAEASGGKLKATTIHPSLVLGPVLEEDYGNSAEVVKRLMDGSFPATPNLGFAIVDVRDTAAMHVLALENDASIGERYVCCGEFKWLIEISQLLKAHYPDKKVPKRKMPSGLVRLFAYVMKDLRSVLSELDVRRAGSWEKAKNSLGWEPRSAEDAILATAKSLTDLKIV